MRKERVIFDSAIDFDATKQWMLEMEDVDDDDPISDERVWQRAADDNQFDYNDQLVNLDQQLPGNIIAIVNAGLWNGRRSGYIMCGDNLNEVLTQGNHDFIRVYSDGYNIRKTSQHHDGTNYILFRMLRPDVDPDVFLDALYNGLHPSTRMINRFTTSLLPYVKKVYGW